MDRRYRASVRPYLAFALGEAESKASLVAFVAGLLMTVAGVVVGARVEPALGWFALVVGVGAIFWGQFAAFHAMRMERDALSKKVVAMSEDRERADELARLFQIGHHFLHSRLEPEQIEGAEITVEQQLQVWRAALDAWYTDIGPLITARFGSPGEAYVKTHPVPVPPDLAFLQNAHNDEHRRALEGHWVFLQNVGDLVARDLDRATLNGRSPASES